MVLTVILAYAVENFRRNFLKENLPLGYVQDQLRKMGKNSNWQKKIEMVKQQKGVSFGTQMKKRALEK
jgi:hypothetical protein